MSIEIKGTITKKIEVETGESKAGKEWKKQNFVLDTGAKYNPEVCFQLFGDDKIDMLEGFNEGQEVTVAFNVSSREFNGKYYHNLDAWKITAIGQPTSKTAEVQPEDDLPF
tara:strand:+ start:232 stop:564 length:333 start_codon:yes stop_codon:yes gene_type:complete